MAKNDGYPVAAPLSTTNSLADRLDLWRMLADRCGGQLADMPYLAPVQAALKEAVGRLQRSFTEQAVLEAQLAAMHERRRRDVAAATELRNRLAAGLTARYGPCGEELRLYGLKPRPRKGARTRKKPASAAAD